MSRTFDGPRNAKLATFQPNTPLKRVGPSQWVGVSRHDANTLVRARIEDTPDGWVSTLETSMQAVDAIEFMKGFAPGTTEPNN